MEVGGNGAGPHIPRSTKGDHPGALSARTKACFIHVEDAACVETILNHELCHSIKQNAETDFSASVPCSQYCLRLPVSQLRVPLHKAVVPPVRQGAYNAV